MPDSNPIDAEFERIKAAAIKAKLMKVEKPVKQQQPRRKPPKNDAVITVRFDGMHPQIKIAGRLHYKQLENAKNELTWAAAAHFEEQHRRDKEVREAKQRKLEVTV